MGGRVDCGPVILGIQGVKGEAFAPMQIPPLGSTDDYATCDSNPLTRSLAAGLFLLLNDNALRGCSYIMREVRAIEYVCSCICMYE